LRKQLKSLSPAAEPIAARAKALDEQLEALLESAAPTRDGGTPQSDVHRGLERVNGDIAGLYQQVEGADAAPTQAQRSAADSLSKDWQSIAVSAAKIWQGALAALNQALTKARLPIVRDDVQAPEEGESADEE
jgi:hypothetical protein